MNDIVRPILALPVPRIAISIRAGTIEDIPFLDALQKMHAKQVGFLPTKALEGKVRLGHVLVAETDERREMRDERKDGSGASSLISPLSSLAPVGYLIGNDQYNKRDDLGIIFQMNVVPGKQRGLIGASLLKAQFERSAYGCKLYCCWCAQDLEANRFWEACGFVPLAFRTGARTKGKSAAGKTGPRTHIFWQKRIREGDATTPWWFPSQTGGGAIREDRLVFPIPSGVHWSDAMPVVLPQSDVVRAARPCLPEARKTKNTPPASRVCGGVGSGFLSFESPPPPKVEDVKKERVVREKVKNNPRYIAAARELRDRWLEHASVNPALLAAGGKYDVSRAIEDRSTFVRLALPMSRPVSRPVLRPVPGPVPDPVSRAA